jgi:acyl-CoA synthetase (AMP-forming)/AMP-acid ligase II
MTTSEESAYGTVGGFLAASTERYADRLALVLGQNKLTYRQWDARSRELACGLLHRNVTKGARIGIMLGNGPDWAVAWAAVTRIGAVAVPLSTLCSPSELRETAGAADLHGLIHHATYRGVDAADLISAAFPELAGSGPELWLPDAPFLRWAVCTGTTRLPWQRSLTWFTDKAGQGDTALVVAAERQVVASDDCCVLFTSGTTSSPKGVVHTHQSLLSQVEFARTMLRFRDGTQCYCPMPFFWLAGQLHGLFPVLAAGGTSYSTESGAPSEVVRLLSDNRVDRMYMVRSQFERLAESPEFAGCDRSSIEIAFPTELLPAGIDADHGSARVCADGSYMGLGMSETYGPYWFGPSVTRQRDPRNDQFPDVPPLTRVAPGFDVAIMTEDRRRAKDGEIGEICVRGRGLMRTLNKHDARDVFDDLGYYHTGDLALVAGSRVYYRGRAGDVIKTAGASVSAAEVERAIESLVPVTRTCAVGIPDERRGSVVAAAVVPADGAQIDTADLIMKLEKVLSQYKVPKYIAVLGEHELPLTASSRVKRRELAEMIRARMAAAEHG